jgi:hypothetical protein
MLVSGMFLAKFLIKDKNSPNFLSGSGFTICYRHNLRKQGGEII